MFEPICIGDLIITLSFLLNIVENLLLHILNLWFEDVEAYVLILLVLLELSVLFKIGKSLWHLFATTGILLILIDDLLSDFLVFVFLTHDSGFLKLSYLVAVFLLLLECLLARHRCLFVAPK